MRRDLSLQHIRGVREAVVGPGLLASHQRVQLKVKR